MTFLAIQEPGITTRCALCDKRYLSPAYLLSKDRLVASSSGDQNESNATDQCTLVELLTRTFDCCIYCGGRIVG
jgi:hypothetical protein